MDKLVSSLLGIFGIVVLIMILVFGIMVIYKMLFKSNSTKKAVEQEESVPEVKAEEKVVYPYKLTKCILSDKERYFYRAVRPIADKMGLLVFTKMRIIDLMYIPEERENRQKWVNKVKSKHIDFIFVDSELKVKLLVEIDDPTHNRPDRIARDEEVDEIFKQLGLKVLHLRAWGEKYTGEPLETTIINALNVQKTAPGSEQKT